MGKIEEGVDRMLWWWETGESRCVEDFVEALELLSSQVERLLEERYLIYFMSGLIHQIRRRVRTLNLPN
jgi:hypothetical protein